MENFTKKDLLLIINVYQNYINDFVNISDEDLNNLYLEIAKQDEDLKDDVDDINYLSSLLYGVDNEQ
tara:strand:- start:942 stop:1142 length:201 start_codon:yes stop_codon:yes gene_type:complete